MGNPKEEAAAALLEVLTAFVAIADRELVLDEEETVFTELLAEARAAIALAEGD